MEEASSTYIVEKDGFTLLLDLGSGGLTKLQKYKNVTDIDAVILSHYHADHCADVGVLQHALLVQSHIQQVDKTVCIYGHKEDEYEFEKLEHDFTKAVAYEPNEVIKLGPFF